MTYSISIYAFDSQLIYTAAVDMYFDKYKGIGPGFYYKPILTSPIQCSEKDIETAILQCIHVLQNNQSRIFKDNSEKNIMQMEKQLFQNFKLFGITASKTQIIKQSIEILIRRKEDGFTLCRCKAEGQHMMVQKEVSLSSEVPMSEVARHVSELLTD